MSYGVSTLDPNTILFDACSRNLPLELHRRRGVESQPVARGRLISMDDETLYLEKPQIIGRELALSVGEVLDAFLPVGEEIYRFATTVGQICRLRLNMDKIVEGRRLAMPSVISPGQRRNFFRVSLAVVTPKIPVALIRADPNHDDACPLDPLRIEGTLVDASGGGFGVRLLNEPAVMRLRIFDYLFTEFEIPETALQVRARCEIRQVREIQSAGYHKLGLQLHAWPDQRAATRTMQPLLRWLNELQRRGTRAA